MVDWFLLALSWSLRNMKMQLKTNRILFYAFTACGAVVEWTWKNLFLWNCPMPSVCIILTNLEELIFELCWCPLGSVILCTVNCLPANLVASVTSLSIFVIFTSISFHPSHQFGRAHFWVMSPLGSVILCTVYCLPANLVASVTSLSIYVILTSILS